LDTKPAPETFAAIETRLRSLADVAAPSSDLELLVLNGDPARRIEEVISERQVDLVVMATHGYGRFRRLLLGSVVAKVLHDTACPVLTGAHLGDQPVFRAAPYRTIACALSLRDRADSERTLRWACDFARSWSASLHVIHVPSSIDSSAGEWFSTETQQLIRQASREQLRTLLADVGCEAAVHAEGLEAVPYVVKVVHDIKADALVIGRSSKYAFFGGDASAMIRESPSAVISV
jgi:nucleotide-binding universal stress UspA family protein